MSRFNKVIRLFTKKQILGTLSHKLQTAEYISVEPEKLVRSIPFSHLAELIKIDDPHKKQKQ